MLDEIRFWAQVSEDARRTIVCSPELESRLKTGLVARGLDGLHTVTALPGMPDDRVYVVDVHAIEADLRRGLLSPRR